jgi:hypothetical protein
MNRYVTSVLASACAGLGALAPTPDGHPHTHGRRPGPGAQPPLNQILSSAPTIAGSTVAFGERFRPAV